MGDEVAFAAAPTAEEVEAIRNAHQQQLQDELANVPGGTTSFAIGMAALNTAAAQRLEQLRKTREGGDAATPSLPAPDALATSAPAYGPLASYNINGKPWDPETNPLVLQGWPQFVNRWLNQRLDNARANIQRMGGNTDQYIQAILTTLPGALFMLMPVFALVLLVAYLGRGIGYLEHLVVALYSHAWLMLVLLATFLVAGASGAFSGPVAAVMVYVVYGLLWLTVPVYLLWTQQRVYGGNFLLTLLRYTLIGGIYFVLVTVVVTYAVLAGVSA